MLKFKHLKRLVLQLKILDMPSRDKQICRLTIIYIDGPVKTKHKVFQAPPRQIFPK